MNRGLRYIITDYGFVRHGTAKRAYEERERLKEQYPHKDFKVLTVLDEPKDQKFKRDRLGFARFEQSLFDRFARGEKADDWTFTVHCGLSLICIGIFMTLAIAGAMAIGEARWFFWPVFGAAAVYMLVMCIWGAIKRSEAKGDLVKRRPVSAGRFE